MLNKVNIKLDGGKMLILEILMTILFFICLPFLFLERVIHKKSYGWKEKFGGGENNKIAQELAKSESKVIHIHCCSVGETLAVENLIKAMREKFYNCKIVLTTFTYAGQQIAQKKFSNIVDYITYFPFDMPISVNKFLSKIRPTVSVIVETEIWPYFAYSCKKRNIPLVIINARISDKSYSQYKFMKLFFAKILKNYNAVYAQSIEDKQKFISIGMNPDKVEMMGNLKFDIVSDKETVDIGQEGFRIFIAGSTHKPENEIVIANYKKLKEKFSDLKLLIAPRHLERVEEIKSFLVKYNLTYGLRSAGDKFDSDTDVIVLDTLGELKKMYSICDIAFIGGSFNNTGGHNPLEAAIYEKPVVSGPAIFNFKDIYDILCKAGAGKVVNTQQEMLDYIKTLLYSPDEYIKTKKNCKDIFELQRGAVNFVLQKLNLILNK